MACYVRGIREELPGEPEGQVYEADLAIDTFRLWADLRVPAGWEPVAQLALQVHRTVDDFSDHVVERIQREIAAYRGPSVPRQDLRASVRSNIDSTLAGLASRTLPSAAHLRLRRELGRRRALQGHPVEALLRAYHVGYREVWRRLVGAVPADQVATTRLLLEAADIHWSWVHQITNVVVDAYAEVQRSKEAEAAGLQLRFLTLVLAGDVDSVECLALAHTFGLPTEGPFHAMVVSTGAPLTCLPPDLATGGCRALAVRHGRGYAIVVAGERDPAREQAIVAALPDATLGVGLVRPGLGGLRLSIIDAERAAAVTSGPGSVVSFEAAWVEATLATALDRLDPVVERGASVAVRHPRLADAVLAFAAARFSLAGAGRRLGIDANTLAYRLDRWEQLTGWDPRCYEGLTRSVECLRLGRLVRARRPTDRHRIDHIKDRHPRTFNQA